MCILSTFLPREARAQGVTTSVTVVLAFQRVLRLAFAGDLLQRFRYFQIAAASDFRMSYLVRFVCELWPLYRDRRHIVWQVIATSELAESNGDDDDGYSYNVIISPFD